MKYPNRTTAAVLAAGAVLTCSAALVAGQAGAQEKQMTVAMITHAQPGDTFWDIIRKGAEAAAKKDNIKLIYLADPTATKEAQLISNVVEQHVDGIALTLAFPDAEASAVKAAQRAGSPIVGFNAGVDQWKSQGLLGYAGQDETVAGKAVGEELNKEGAKNVVCLDQQQGAVQLEARCNYVVTLGAAFAPVVLEAVTASGSKAEVGTFDLSPVAIDLIANGKVQWAVDQQPYVEGYEAVDMLRLYVTNGDTVGGGGPVLTGPFFVTKDNAAAVAKYAKAGTR